MSAAAARAIDAGIFNLEDHVGMLALEQPGSAGGGDEVLHPAG
jgi:hypothetical protein